MLVYGDRPRRQDPRALVQSIAEALDRLPARGIERHATLVGAFIEAAELAQGLADAEFEARACDACSKLQAAAMDVVMGLARAVLASWRSDFEPAPVGVDLTPLALFDLPGEITTRIGEGYAFYALYPEAYAEAAIGLGEAQAAVVGIRSIGTGLAAMVATTLGAARPITVRPVGHPFRRELRLAPELQAELAAKAGGAFAIVDEGPGLSGSSFAAVAGALEASGADPRRLVFFPSHAGEPGAQADPGWRARWRAARRPTVTFDDLVLNSTTPAHRLESWVEDLTGPALSPLEDISGGAWRTSLARADWPPANTYQERRKFLLRSRSGTWLLKFAGLGREGQAKAERAQAIGQAGFTPEVLGLRHGFLVERWIEAARPLDPRRVDRRRLVQHLAGYLGFRAEALPAGADDGASLAELLEMARANTSEALGPKAAARIEARTDQIAELQAKIRRVETDNRLHLWEWLVSPDGRLVKTDAVDHAHAHDLVGCQDLAWDVAGAAAEFDLTADEEAELREGLRLDARLLAFLKPCYLAFQLGAYAMAAEAHLGWPEEEARLARMRDRYAARLSRLLAPS